MLTCAYISSSGGFALRPFLFAGAAVLTLLPPAATTARAGFVFTDWTSVNTTTNVATGTLGSVGVTLSGGDVFFGDTNGTFTGFNYPFFSPQLATTDVVELIGANPPGIYTYTVSFTGPVTNVRLHIGSLASTLTFSTAVTRVSGQSDFVVAGNTVTGALHDAPADPKDSNGTIDLAGTFSSFTFTARGTQVFTGPGDGFYIQIGADLPAVPGPGGLTLLGSGAVALLGYRGRRCRSRTGRPPDPAPASR